jgi:short-subunit dehydrogenase
LDSKKGIVGDGPYVSAKSALDGFGDVLRQEVKKMGIKVLTVYPARVDTPMIQDLKVPRVSPKISAEKVADKMIRAIYKDKAILVVPRSNALLGALNSLFPKLMDWVYKKFRIEGVREE